MPPLSAIAQPDLNDMGWRLISQMPSFSFLLANLVFLFGFGMAIFGLWKFYEGSRNPNDRSNRAGVAFIFIFCGALMVAIPSLMGAGIMTFFGDSGATDRAMTGIGGFTDF